MKKRFKLIKSYPDSPELGTIVDGSLYYLPNGTMLSGLPLEAGEFSEFWKEIPVLKYPIGTRFTVNNKNLVDNTIYTLKELIGDNIIVSWFNDEEGLNYNFKIVNYNFINGIWTIKKDPKIAFIDHNGNDVYVGDHYFFCWNGGGMNTGQGTATEYFTKTIGNNEVINFKFEEERDSYIEFFSKTLSIDDVMTKLIDNINDVITSKVISEITEILCLDKTEE